MNTWAPRERICMCTHTHTHIGLAHAHTPCAPYVQSLFMHALQSHINSHTCPHGNGKGQKQAGCSGAGEKAALPQATGWKLAQASSLLEY